MKTHGRASLILFIYSYLRNETRSLYLSLSLSLDLFEADSARSIRAYRERACMEIVAKTKRVACILRALQAEMLLTYLVS